MAIYTNFVTGPTLAMFLSLIINKNIFILEIVEISAVIFLISIFLQIFLNFSSGFLRLPYSIISIFKNEINYEENKIYNTK